MIYYTTRVLAVPGNRRRYRGKRRITHKAIGVILAIKTKEEQEVTGEPVG